MSSSSSYQPQPTQAVPTGAQSIELHTSRSPRVDGVRQGFEATFGGYRPPDWTLDAECTRPDVDPRDFFGERGGSNAATNRALKVCSSCIVREKCLEDALSFESGEIDTGDLISACDGVRGGMTGKERRPIAKKRSLERMARIREAVVADCRAGALSIEQMSAKHKVAADSVRRWAKAAGVQLREPNGGRSDEQHEEVGA